MGRECRGTWRGQSRLHQVRLGETLSPQETTPRNERPLRSSSRLWGWNRGPGRDGCSPQAHVPLQASHVGTHSSSHEAAVAAPWREPFAEPELNLKHIEGQGLSQRSPERGTDTRPRGGLCLLPKWGTSFGSCWHLYGRRGRAARYLCWVSGASVNSLGGKWLPQPCD